jgi:hypothetical protein
LFPGRSSAGKSTLVAELVRRGATYLSDEFAVLDSGGLVHPYALPIRMLKEDRIERVRPQELGTVAARPMPAGMVVLTSYDRQARWAPRRLSPGRGLLEMLRHTIPAQTRPEAALAALRKVVARAPVLKGRRGEAGTTADLVIAAVGKRRWGLG